MKALAVTDHGNMFGAVAFYDAAMDKGIKPILGCEIYVAPGSRHDKAGSGIEEAYNHLTLLAADEAGYHNLMKLVSIGYTEGFYHRPRIDKEVLASHAQGLIGLSGCLSGEIAQHIRGGPGARPPWSRSGSSARSSARTASTSRSWTTASRSSGGSTRACYRLHGADGPAPGRHQRRALPAPRRPPGPRRPALHRLGQEGARDASACASTPRSST